MWRVAHGGTEPFYEPLTKSEESPHPTPRKPARTSTGGRHDGPVRRREERRHRGSRVSAHAALAPRAREQRRETMELSRDSGSSRLFSPRRHVGTKRGLVAVTIVVGHPGGAQGEPGRHAPRGSNRGRRLDTRR